MKFCINCGEKLVDGAKYCHSCGFAVNANVKNKNQRKEEYVGVVFKCSNCGATISQSTAICPSCGMKITGKDAVSSIKDFKEQLMLIESTRKKSKFMDVYTQSANPADTKKLSLIRSFPIPNTVDDILEFILLASANIDIKLSKQSTSGKISSWMNSGNINLSIQKTISDAWVSKLEQAYQKALMLFPNTVEFTNIEKIYLTKLKELKIRK